MKKSILLAFGLLLTPLFMGCEGSTDTLRLTYGTYMDNEAREVTCEDIISKKENENFILATYGDTSCGCWTNFSKVIDYACANYNLLVYKMSIEEIDNTLKDFGFKKSKDPAFYIVANKRIAKSFFYEENPDIFGFEKQFLSAVKDKIDLPYMYFISEEQIASKVEDTTGMIYYMWSSCPDCRYCTPHVLMPYFKNKQITNPIYVFDCDPIRAEGEQAYIDFKADHFMSETNSPEFGYSTGYVPMFQYFQDGELIDACVCYNDEITNGVISKSYYSSERVNHLHYLDKLERKVLTGVTVKPEEIKNDHWVSHDIQNTYYQPFLEAFLDTYLR